MKEEPPGYRSALRRLVQLVDIERLSSTKRDRVRYDLSRMEALLSRLDDPHLGIPTVHIAGTKGKGSTAAMCASVLSQQGYRTGLFTSPHLHSFRERICLDGLPVSEETFAALVDEVWPALDWISAHEEYGGVSVFEALSAMAFRHFRKEADFQVLEVGLGGRLDTTNLVTPDVCAITSLSLDHTAILGDTIERIASEKGGIIKPGAKVVASPQSLEAMAVIESICEEKGTELIRVGTDLTWSPGPRNLEGQDVNVRGRLGNYELHTPLLGEHQLENAATAVGALEVLMDKGFEISSRAFENGMSRLSWACRMEVLRTAPLVVCDGAHNPYSAARLRDSLPAYFNYGSVILVVGVSQDKNLEGIVAELAGLSRPLGKEGRVIVTRSRHPRASPPGALAHAFLTHHIKALEVEGVDSAIEMALELADADDLVLATGSLFVAAEAREAIKGIEPELYPELERPPSALAR